MKNSPSQGISSLGIIRGMDHSNQGNQNPRWKVPIGSLGSDVDPSTEALLRATVSPSIIVPSKFTKKITDVIQSSFTDINLISLVKPPGIPKPPKSLNPSSTGSISGLNLSKVNQKALDISTLNESFSKYLLHVLHQIPNMGFDLNLIKDCILPHSLMVIKSNLDTTRKRKTLIILSQVTMYLLHLSPRNKLPSGSKGNLKSGIYDDVLQWVNKILLHPDLDQSEIPIMIGVEMRGKRINPILQSSLSEYLKDSTINFETMKNKEMEYTHLFGAALVDEWLIGYYTDVWRKLTKVTRYEFNPEKMLYRGLLKSSSVEDEFEQKIPLDQMKLKLGLTIRICELIGEDSISKEIESLTNLLIQMNLSSKLLENKRIIKLFLTYQSQLLQSSKENLNSKIFKHLSIEKLMKEFILNVEDLILNEDHPSFISTWLKESLSKFLLTQEDDHQILHFDQHLKLLSFSILTHFFKQISELTVQDPILKSKFQKTLGKFASE
ncbi:hypothetical protein DFH28DRAFT_1079871 [Melampsora americana]|nr:hypothetical protein DFH28DRAFT_1079871 [Melampsora americana]